MNQNSKTGIEICSALSQHLRKSTMSFLECFQSHTNKKKHCQERTRTSLENFLAGSSKPRRSEKVTTVVQLQHPSIRRLKPGDCREFKTSLGYIVNPRPAWATM